MRADLQRLLDAVVVRDRGPEYHTAPSGLLLAPGAQLIWKAMLHVDIPLFEYADAVARRQHVLRRIKLELYHNGAVDLLLRARRGVLSAHPARLVEHVRRHLAHVCTYENLKENFL